MWKENLNSSKLKKCQKIVMSTAIILGMFTPSIIVNADHGSDPPFIWKMYPYHPPGTVIMFPNDEGAHDTNEYPIEWWYANFYLKNQTTGHEYGAFASFFQIKTGIPKVENIEIRLLSISDFTEMKTYTNRKFGTLSACTDHLDLTFAPHDDNYLNNFDFNQCIPSNNQVVYALSKTMDTRATSMNVQMMPRIAATPYHQSIPAIADDDDGDDGGGPIQNDVWFTKTDGDDLLPFQYTLLISGDAQQEEKQPMQLSVDMDGLKRPLIVGGNGLVDLGEHGFSYYYCLTKLNVTGMITVHGITEEVTGFAWIDHQWGDFFYPNPPPFGVAVSYEWFSIKLDDNREIMAGDTWDRDTGEKINQSFSGGLNLFNSDETLELLEDYTITPLSFWTDPIGQRNFSSQWYIHESSHDINITITPIYADQMMRLFENFPLFQLIISKLIPGTCFWEGTCMVSGTIGGASITGKAYVELTHSYD